MNTLPETDVKTFKSKLNNAFSKLRKAGYIAKQNFMCCNSCAWAEFSEEVEKVVFYHAQNTPDIKDGFLRLSWSGNVTEICNVLLSEGLFVRIPENADKKIFVCYDFGSLEK
jgi:hypothetical protein